MRKLLAWWLSPNIAVLCWCTILACVCVGAVDAQPAGVPVSVPLNLTELLTAGVGALIAIVWRHLVSITRETRDEVRAIRDWMSHSEVVRERAKLQHAEFYRRLDGLDGHGIGEPLEE